MNPIIFSKLDFLVIALAAVIHDLGLFDPEDNKYSENPRMHPANLIENYLKILSDWVNNQEKPYREIFGIEKGIEQLTHDKGYLEKVRDYASQIEQLIKEAKSGISPEGVTNQHFDETFNRFNNSINDLLNQIFRRSNLSKFAWLFLLIAMYHPKDMVLDEAYRKIRVEQLKEKLNVVGKHQPVGGTYQDLEIRQKISFIKHICSFEEMLRFIIGDSDQNGIEHYKLLEAIIQLGDAISVWKLMEKAFDVYKRNIDYVHGKYGDSQPSQIENTVDALFKDLISGKQSISSKMII
ncbi:MAG: hypothetical protein ACP5UZ_08610 [Thermoplasmata archaeon]